MKYLSLIIIFICGCTELAYKDQKCALDEFVQENQAYCRMNTRTVWTPFWDTMFVLQNGSNAPNKYARDPSKSYTHNFWVNSNIITDSTGRPIIIKPAFNDPTGNYSDSIIKTPNAYGPGIHMDQYGRAITSSP